MRNPTISPRLVHSPDGILPKGCYITGFTNSWYMERFLPLRKYPFLQQPPWLGLFSTNILMADSCEIQNAHFKFYKKAFSLVLVSWNIDNFKKLPRIMRWRSRCFRRGHYSFIW
jgi:hypothetical protein